MPHDGETFTDDSLEDFQDRLISLKELGYQVPDYVLEVVAAEMAEEQATPTASH